MAPRRKVLRPDNALVFGEKRVIARGELHHWLIEVAIFFRGGHPVQRIFYHARFNLVNYHIGSGNIFHFYAPLSQYYT